MLEKLTEVHYIDAY